MNSLKLPAWMAGINSRAFAAPIIIIMMLSMMVLPLPAFVLDIFFSFNIALSVIVQVGSFKLTGRRVLRMAPLQHHFELLGWQEVTIVVRFWIIAGLFVALGLGIFYAEWVVGS